MLGLVVAAGFVSAALVGTCAIGIDAGLIVTAGFVSIAAAFMGRRMIAVIGTADGISGKTTNHAADHRTANTLRSQSADGSAAHCAYRGIGIVRMTAALIGLG